MSPLCSVPQEILENIAYELTCFTPLGPPSSLIPLLLTCKSLNNRLSANTALFSRIFKFKFDDSAVKRRAFDPTPSQYFDQLVLYCQQLSKLCMQVQADDCDDVLFSAYLMMLEHDGKNAAQLQHAGLDSYLDLYVRTRLWDCREDTHGWPVDGVANACALWLMWMTTTDAKLKAESEARRNQIIKLVLPYVLVPFRYASALVPQNHFNLPLRNAFTPETNSFITAHGPYPVYLDARRAWSQVHFGTRPTIIPPLVTVAAKLIYLSRRETIPFGVPPHLPLNREHALAAGITQVGPTQEDILEINAHLNNRLPEVRAGWDEDDADEPLSRRWDSDWCRATGCFSAWRENDRRLGRTYAPGSFTGLWQGRMLVPSEDHFTALVTTRDYPPTFDEGHLGTTTIPLFMRIQEHRSYAPNTPVPCGGAGDGWDDGLANAYFPPHTRFVPHAHGLTVRVGDGGDDEVYEYASRDAHDAEECAECAARETRRRRIRTRRAAAAYEEHFARVGLVFSDPADADEGEGEGEDEMDDAPYVPHRVPECDGIQDIIFTGATDERHGQAWNHYEFYGRLRPWDGLIGILRFSRDPRLGTIFFYGFVVGGHNFVGNWRIAHQDEGVPAWESAFTMSRRDD
ncbi:hypothetical protein B0H10DRAFT_1950385 [Mycena sp. CBHHK59/15]|nr:hypothetical protein B0H10DRAFT_1950385 [Mycena sp. CBHHK59/15]